MASSLKLGFVDFKYVTLDPAEVARIFEKFVAHGSKLNQVSSDDPVTNVKVGTVKEALNTVADCLAVGMRLFDAVVWLKSGKVKEISIDPSITDEKIATPSDISSALFYCFFFLLTQARYPSQGNKDQLTNVPAFLANILGLNKGQKYYSDIMCGFDIVKFDPKWVRYYPLQHLSQEALSRFGLGVAGYRLSAPFKLYAPDKDGHDKRANAIKFAETLAKSPPSWDIHPVTRKPDVLSKYGNLNNNLGNLILDVYKEETIDEMVSAKILYAKPVRVPRNREYIQWSVDQLIFTEENIFK